MTVGPQLLSQREVAERWRISVRTLERWRGERYGPAWIMIGGSVRYRLADIEAFESAQTVGRKT